MGIKNASEWFHQVIGAQNSFEEVGWDTHTLYIQRLTRGFGLGFWRLPSLWQLRRVRKLFIRKACLGCVKKMILMINFSTSPEQKKQKELDINEPDLTCLSRLPLADVATVTAQFKVSLSGPNESFYCLSQWFIPLTSTWSNRMQKYLQPYSSQQS